MRPTYVLAIFLSTIHAVQRERISDAVPIGEDLTRNIRDEIDIYSSNPNNNVNYPIATIVAGISVGYLMPPSIVSYPTISRTLQLLFSLS